MATSDLQASHLRRHLEEIEERDGLSLKVIYSNNDLTSVVKGCSETHLWQVRASPRTHSEVSLLKMAKTRREFPAEAEGERHQGEPETQRVTTWWTTSECD